MIAQKSHVVYADKAWTAILAAGLLLAVVMAGGVKSLTWLWEREDLMHALGMASCLAPMAAIGKATINPRVQALSWSARKLNRVGTTVDCCWVLDLGLSCTLLKTTAETNKVLIHPRV